MKVFFFLLACSCRCQPSILVKQRVTVRVAQHSRNIRSKHEQGSATPEDLKSSTSPFLRIQEATFACWVWPSIWHVHNAGCGRSAIALSNFVSSPRPGMKLYVVAKAW